MAMDDDRGISDAFFTVMSIGIVVLAGILVANIVLTLAGSQGKAAAERLEGLQAPAMESGLNAFYYAIDPAASDLSSADPNKIPPDSFVVRRVDASASVSPSSLPEVAPDKNGLIIWTGYVVVPAEGDYTFTLESAGGSWLWVDGGLTANNYGDHPRSSLSGAPVHLPAGQHKLKARYFYTSTAFCMITGKGNNLASELRYCH